MKTMTLTRRLRVKLLQSAKCFVIVYNLLYKRIEIPLKMVSLATYYAASLDARQVYPIHKKIRVQIVCSFLFCSIYVELMMLYNLQRRNPQARSVFSRVL